MKKITWTLSSQQTLDEEPLNFSPERKLYYYIIGRAVMDIKLAIMRWGRNNTYPDFMIPEGLEFINGETRERGGNRPYKAKFTNECDFISAIEYLLNIDKGEEYCIKKHLDLILDDCTCPEHAHLSILGAAFGCIATYRPIYLYVLKKYINNIPPVVYERDFLSRYDHSKATQAGSPLTIIDDSSEINPEVTSSDSPIVTK